MKECHRGSRGGCWEPSKAFSPSSYVGQSGDAVGAVVGLLSRTRNSGSPGWLARRTDFTLDLADRELPSLEEQDTRAQGLDRPQRKSFCIR